MLLSESEKDEFIPKYSSYHGLIRRYIGGHDFLHSDEKRYCLGLKGISSNRYANIPEIKIRLEKVKEFREASTSKDTQKSAKTQYLFFRTPHIETEYIIILKTTSQHQEYLPVGFMNKETIGSDALMIIYNANIYTFGIIMSNVHAAWLRFLDGRLKSDYRYSTIIVYNSFPCYAPTDEQKAKIERPYRTYLTCAHSIPTDRLPTSLR